MKKTIALLIAISSVLFALPAIADDSSGACCRSGGTPKWYFGLSGAMTFLTSKDINERVTFPGFGFTESFPTSYDIGYTASAQLGRRIYPNIRVEFEGSYRQNQLKSFDHVLQTGTPVGITSTAYMGNLYYDFHFFGPKFSPYVGAGIGPVAVHDGLGDDSWRLAHEFMVGVNYDLIAGTTPFEINLGYRYFDSADPSFGISNIVTYKYSVETNNIELGGKLFF